MLLQEAVRLEDYGKAVLLRDQIQELEEADPILRLETQLKAAIEAQSFEASLPHPNYLHGLDTLYSRACTAVPVTHHMADL